VRLPGRLHVPLTEEGRQAPREASQKAPALIDITASQLAAVFGLAASASFGSGDFCGGIAAKRSHVFGVLATGRACGFIAAAALAALSGEEWPSIAALGWACAAGVVGTLALPAFYRALAIGKMGIGAPVTSVLAAGVPVVVATVTQGFPKLIQVVGLLLALVALWLMSRPQGRTRPEGLGLAVFAGLGFGAFLVCIHLAGSESLYWAMAVALATSLVLSLIILIAQGGSLPRFGALPIAATAGLLDTCGNVSFVLASRYGRLDVAAILSSLYPGVTVLLAWLLLKERITPLQSVGMTAALIAVPLITAY